MNSIKNTACQPLSQYASSQPIRPTSFKGYDDIDDELSYESDDNFYRKDSENIQRDMDRTAEKYEKLKEKENDLKKHKFGAAIFKTASIGLFSVASGLLAKKVLLDKIVLKVVKKTSFNEKIIPVFKKILNKADGLLQKKESHFNDPQIMPNSIDKGWKKISDIFNKAKSKTLETIDTDSLYTQVKLQKYGEANNIKNPEVLKKVAKENLPELTKAEEELALSNALAGRVGYNLSKDVAMGTGMVVGAVEGVRSDEQDLDKNFQSKIRSVGLISDLL